METCMLFLNTTLLVCEQCPNVKDDSEGNFISADIEKGIQDGNSSGGHYEEEKVARGDDVIVDLDATLEDLYMGGSLKKLVIGVKATCFDLLPKFDKVMTDHHIYFITSYSKGVAVRQARTSNPWRYAKDFERHPDCFVRSSTPRCQSWTLATRGSRNGGSCDSSRRACSDATVHYSTGPNPRNNRAVARRVPPRRPDDDRTQPSAEPSRRTGRQSGATTPRVARSGAPQGKRAVVAAEAPPRAALTEPAPPESARAPASGHHPDAAAAPTVVGPAPRRPGGLKRAAVLPNKPQSQTRDVGGKFHTDDRSPIELTRLDRRQIIKHVNHASAAGDVGDKGATPQCTELLSVVEGGVVQRKTPCQVAWPASNE
ncbi:hypothetical protein R6Q59_016056 [Mikania micrantha]